MGTHIADAPLGGESAFSAFLGGGAEGYLVAPQSMFRVTGKSPLLYDVDGAGRVRASMPTTWTFVDSVAIAPLAGGFLVVSSRTDEGDTLRVFYRIVR